MKLYHFEIDRVVEVNDRQAEVLKQSGWVEHRPEDELPVDGVTFGEVARGLIDSAEIDADVGPITYRFADVPDSDGASWLDPPDTDEQSD